MARLILLLVLLLPALAQAAPERITSIEAAFHQEKHLPILAQPIVSEGRFSFQAPQSLRWEYQSPVHSVLLLHQGRISKFIDRDGQLRQDQGMGLDAMQVVLAEISNWLDGRFTDNQMFAVSQRDPQTIVLTPKDPGLAALINRIELQLADQAGLLDTVTIIEGQEAWTSLHFADRQLNQPIPEERFTKP
jgi:outer membrane lipoprotein-sorting protein